jgi:hypothetical protein
MNSKKRDHGSSPYFLQGVVPFGGDIIKMQGDQPNLFRCHITCATEVRFTSIQPWQWVGGTIVAWEAELGPVE